jgi:hypothetical protein
VKKCVLDSTGSGWCPLACLYDGSNEEAGNFFIVGKPATHKLQVFCRTVDTACSGSATHIRLPVFLSSM